MLHVRYISYKIWSCTIKRYSACSEQSLRQGLPRGVLVEWSLKGAFKFVLCRNALSINITGQSHRHWIYILELWTLFTFSLWNALSVKFANVKSLRWLLFVFGYCRCLSIQGHSVSYIVVWIQRCLSLLLMLYMYAENSQCLTDGKNKLLSKQTIFLPNI